MEANTIPAKYVFLDVVNFSQNRSVEAQSDIITALNSIVKTSLRVMNIAAQDAPFEMAKFLEESISSQKPYILSPTGDGMCISLLNIEKPYDIHLQLALSIIKGVHDHNNATENKMRRFEVRIGLNANTDNLVADVNGNLNIAGAGINMASRVMDLADGNQILVGQSVYDTLSQHEKYMDVFDAYVAIVKHNIKLPVFQFKQEGHLGLNIRIPAALLPRFQVEERLTKKAAYFIAHAMKNKDFLVARLTGHRDEYSAIILLWFLAEDSEAASTSTEISTPPMITYKAGVATFEEQLNFYDDIVIFVASEFSNLVGKTLLSQYKSCFRKAYNRTYSFVSPDGAQKLKREWPDIWNEFEFEE